MAQSLPPHARPGECYRQAVFAPAFRTVTEKVAGPPIVSDRYTPPILAQGTKRVLVTPARVTWEALPAVYKTAPRFTLAPGEDRLIKTPAVYRTVTERTLTSPAHLEWSQSRPGAQFAVNGDDSAQSVRATGEVMCRILVPALYAMRSHTVLVSPEGVRRVRGAAHRVVCYVKVLVRPAQKISHRIAAVYRTVSFTEVRRPASHQRVVTSGPMRLVSRQVVVRPASQRWVRIGCVPHSTTAAATRRAGQPYRPDEILAPTPVFPPPAPALSPAPYDVGHPAR